MDNNDVAIYLCFGTFSKHCPCDCEHIKECKEYTENKVKGEKENGKRS
jgi:hypothetical protein